MYQKKDGDGALFQNRKQKDSHPDVRGDLLLDGKEYEIAGWQKATRNGDPWWSLKVQPKRQQQAGAKRQEPAPQRNNLRDFSGEKFAQQAPDFDFDAPW